MQTLPNGGRSKTERSPASISWESIQRLSCRMWRASRNTSSCWTEFSKRGPSPFARAGSTEPAGMSPLPAEHSQELFELHAHLLDDLLALADIDARLFATE